MLLCSPHPAAPGDLPFHTACTAEVTSHGNTEPPARLSPWPPCPPVPRGTWLFGRTCCLHRRSPSGWRCQQKPRAFPLLGAPPGAAASLSPAGSLSQRFLPAPVIGSVMGKRFIPDARGGTSVVQGTGSYLSADSTVITL